ncbi:hypothetical protein PRJ39_15610 [Lysobacter enzymogenes]|uniref:hypothetical protein n=1 Tax=Lysobacter enzymogenes TaxID=69 RepID=UPI00374A0B5E
MRAASLTAEQARCAAGPARRHARGFAAIDDCDDAPVLRHCDGLNVCFMRAVRIYRHTRPYLPLSARRSHSRRTSQAPKCNLKLHETTIENKLAPGRPSQSAQRAITPAAPRRCPA